jgi:serine/threonine-protein kinase
MTEPQDPNQTVDTPSTPLDSLDAGLAAGFGRPPDGPGSVLAELRSHLGPLQPVLLGEAEGDSALIVKPRSDALPPPEQTGERYQLSGEIARGGMGAVLRGRDVDLGRDLAVKVLLEKYTDRPEVVRRFLEEAQVGAQLQHPGVVPVYDIGRFGDRPFFTMKLVKGQTLAALLSERTSPAADRPRFLAIALQVCQTLAYTHAKGVIHRDLKPANVMVGAFGEVQVMDWGLAKVLQQGGVADEEQASQERPRPEEGTQIRTARSGTAGSGTDTEAGTLLGTPAYMPPEQANGDLALLDRRADVFGLGALLCEILTGKPPYVGHSGEEIRRKAANGDLAQARARLDHCGADGELVALTLACLAPEAADRPKDARAVAEALTAYLDGVQERLHQAELAEAEAKARAIEEAKRRRLTLTLAATVLLALTLSGGGWLWVKTERDARRVQTTRDVNEALNQATALREKAKTAPTGGAAWFAQAREQAQRALALVESGPADAALTDQVRRLQAELDEEEKDRTLIAALDEARLAQAATAANKSRFAFERAVPKFREALGAYGLPAGQGEVKAVAQRLRQRPAAVREAVLAAWQEWIDLATTPEYHLPEPHLDWLRAVVAAAEPADPWARALRAALAEADATKRRQSLEKLAAEVAVSTQSPRSLTRLAKRLDDAPAVVRWRYQPLGPVALHLLRRAQQQYPADFWINSDLGNGLRADRSSSAALTEALRYLTVAVALRPDSPGAHLNLGVALADQGRAEEAIACYHKALALEPKYATAHNNLGTALADQGRVDEAIACYRKAIVLDPNYAPAHYNLGAELVDKGQLDAAIASYQKAVASDPTFAEAHNNLGNALRDKGRVDEAIACFKRAIALDPRDAKAHYNLGNALLGKGELDEAIACYQKAIELDPTLARPHSDWGVALYRKGQGDAAIVCFRKAIELDPNLVQAHYNLGVILSDFKRDYDRAIACFKRALELNPKDAMAHFNLGNALLGKGQVGGAIACYQKALALDPKCAAAHYNLGNALGRKGQVDEAIASFKKVIALDPNYAAAHNNLGNALRRKGQVDAAIDCFRKAIEVDPKCVAAHHNLGNALGSKGQFDKAIACFRKALDLDPKYAEAHCNLGHALLRLGRFAESLASFKRGHELGSKQPGWPYPSAAWVRQVERLAALEAKLPAFLKGKEQPASAEDSLELASMCRTKQLYAAAVRFSAAAFAGGMAATSKRSYTAAACALLAADGQGSDAARLNDKEKAALRRQALDWLKAALKIHRQQLEDEGQRAQGRQALQHWQKDPDLHSIRAPQALAKLPAAERVAWQELWTAVAQLLQKAETQTEKQP